MQVQVAFHLKHSLKILRSPITVPNIKEWL